MKLTRNHQDANKTQNTPLIMISTNESYSSINFHCCGDVAVGVGDVINYNDYGLCWCVSILVCHFNWNHWIGNKSYVNVLKEVKSDHEKESL